MNGNEHMDEANRLLSLADEIAERSLTESTISKTDRWWHRECLTGAAVHAQLANAWFLAQQPKTPAELVRALNASKRASVTGGRR